MTKKTAIILVITVLVCMFLSNIVFARFSILGVRPDVIMALCVTLGILTGNARSQIICGAIGMLYDITTGPLIGLFCMIYVVCGLVCGMFFRKFYTDNVIFPSVLALVLAFIKEHILCLVAVLGGASLNYGIMLFAYIIPCAIFTALVTLVLFALLKRPLGDYGKYISDKQSSII